ncbi:unnamed protein product [Lactuca saligna]|uniref:Uncharacterized protein n=1 Tax=Lactuca saligna TaxID=75948 RepID=A0AA35Z4W9_LACSI|nr:unnamed protein product [Lactuca saligna]
MSAPPHPSRDLINSQDFLNLNDLHSIVCDNRDEITTNQIKMLRLEDQLIQDFILCRVDHISLEHKQENHDKKFKAIVVVMGVVKVAMLRMMVVGLKFVMKLG